MDPDVILELDKDLRETQRSAALIDRINSAARLTAVCSLALQ